VRIYDRDRMSLLGLAMGSSIERAFAAAPGAPPALRGTIALEAGGMGVTVRFGAEGAEIRQGVPRKASARLSGELVPLVELAAGELPFAALLGRRVRLSGNLRLLWRFAQLLRSARAAAPGAGTGAA